MISYNPIPVLFKIGSVNIHSFGVMLALSALAFLILVRLKAKKTKIINPDNVYTLLFLIIIFSLIGARIVYSFVNMDEMSSVYDLFTIWKGGLSGIGALLGGIFGFFLFSRAQKINFLLLADFTIPYVALSFAIGRIGCFLRGCCFGLQTSLPWGILYGEGSLAASAGFSVPVHPTQLYLFLGNFLMFLVLLKVNKNKFENKKKTKQYGSTFFLFLAWFSLQRFLIDFIRYYPEGNYVGNFTIFQILYGLVFAFAIFFIFLLFKRRKL